MAGERSSALDVTPEEAIARARELVAGAGRVAVLTGAGVSAESGIPTFRGVGGFWRTHRAEDLATPAAFARDPLLVWEWYDWRRGAIAAAEPNPAHDALVRLEARALDFTLITQNVDGLHARAGSVAPLELHGSIWTLLCTRCGAAREDRAVPLAPLPPRCPCGGIERPGVVWFGESLPHATMDRAAEAAAACDLFLLVGTSAVVWPAAGLGEIAMSVGAPVIEISLDETSYSDRVLSLRGKAGELLPKIV
jgi:NAD-dependent deacetylase